MTQQPLFAPTVTRPLSWLRLPAIGTAVTITGMPEQVWAYVGPVEYGKDYQAVVLVRWPERDNRYAQRVVCPVSSVTEEVAQ